MTLQNYLRVLAERWKVIVLFVLVSVGIALVITSTTTRIYQANVEIFVASSDQSNGLNYQGAAFTTVQAQTFATIANSDDIVKDVLSDTQVPLTPAQLKSRISASAPTGQSIVDLHVQDVSPDRSAALANSAATYFVKVVESYYKGTSGSSAHPLRLHVTDKATSPKSPISPNPLLNVSLGLVLGLLVGVAVAVALDVLDNRVKDVEDLAKTAGKPAMGTISDDSMADRHPVATRSGPRNLRAENFRQLRANLQFANVDAHPRVIAITSSIAGEGKSMVAINLASTLAEAGFTVCLVDGDLRRPTIAQSLGLAGAVGLTSVLIHQVALNDALQNAGSNLYVLASGPTPPNPSEVLASSYVREVIRSLLDKVDYVVIDTAPLLPVADGAEVAALADGTLLVARYKRTTEAQVKRARAALRRVDATLLGVVLNRIPSKRSGEYGYTYYRARPVDQPDLENARENGRRSRFANIGSKSQ